jgi:hypothetical protein
VSPSAASAKVMIRQAFQQLKAGYTSEVDTIDDREWYRHLGEFDDANVYQTPAYGAATSGQQNASRLLLKKDGHVVAMAQARVAKLPGVKIGIAYVRWGPLWVRAGTAEQPEVFQQAIRALRNEFAGRRGLVIRLLPVLFDDNASGLASVLAEEGYAPAMAAVNGRTILMDLTHPLTTLREGMNSHWKREIKVAEKKGLQVIEGEGDELFATLIAIHREMVSRKKFAEGSDIDQFRSMQALLPDNFKMRIMICRSEAGVCAGLVCSAIGNTAVYLFGATSNVGMKSNGSYLLHWKLLGHLKARGHRVYDLNGVNPISNPGTYKFKRDLAGSNGREVAFLGLYESPGSMLSSISIQAAQQLARHGRAFSRSARHLIKSVSWRRPGSRTRSAASR